MKNIIKLICIFVSVATMSCCAKDDGINPEQQTFMDKNDYGVYTPTADTFVYFESSCQLYYSPTKHSSRILRDDLSMYVTVTFNDDISSGATVKGTVQCYGFSGNFKDSDLQILKVEDGKAWVWYNKGTVNVGYLIPWGI